MAAILHQLDQRRLIDTNGIADGASIYFYATGGLTPASVYTTAALSVEHSSPIVVAAGAAVPNIYLDSSVTYRRRIVYPDGSVDDTDPYTGGVILAADLASTAAGFGAGLVAGAAIVTRPEDYGATGDGTTDDSAAVQDAIDTASSGGTVRFSRGTYNLASGITVSDDDVCLEFEAGASITYSTATQTTITIAGDRCKISGGKITAPATFDGTNSAITYGTVKVTGEYCVIDGLRLVNVPRVGIWFYECNNGIVTNCIIDGGTTEGFYTGSNTVHFGLLIDPLATGSQGNFVVNGNIIRRCTQGAGSGSTGSASYEQAIAVTGNVFELCWNHGWYTSGLANGVSVTGNAFNACQIPIALTGADHVVVGNTLTVQSSAEDVDAEDDGSVTASDNEITGISLRDPVRCVVSSNVIKGEGIDSGVVIELRDNTGVAGANVVTDNIVSNNVIDITNSTTGGVVAIRFLGNSTEVSNNICQGNVITAPVRTNTGLVEFIGSSASKNNHFRGNILRMTRTQSGSSFLVVNTTSYTKIEGNTFELAADHGSALTLIGVMLVSCSYAATNHNHFVCTSAWGTNITFRIFQELTAATNNSASGNRTHFDTTKLAGSQLFIALNSGPFYLEHRATGSPESSVIAGPGSIWIRTDGAAGTTLYVKESGNSNTGWRPMGKATAPTTTYAAPSGGATQDAECRASLAQLAVDLADLKTKLATAVLTA